MFLWLLPVGFLTYFIIIVWDIFDTFPGPNHNPGDGFDSFINYHLARVRWYHHRIMRFIGGCCIMACCIGAHLGLSFGGTDAGGTGDGSAPQAHPGIQEEGQPGNGPTDQRQDLPGPGAGEPDGSYQLPPGGVPEEQKPYPSSV